MFISKRCKCISKDSNYCISGIETETLSKDLNLLSVKSRLDILFHLKDTPHCVCDLETHTDLSQSLISHHLSDLANGELIEGRREGKYMDYYLTKKGERFLKALIMLLKTKGGDKNDGKK